MNIITRERLNDILDLAGLDDEIIDPDYSGRAMFGEMCFGVVPIRGRSFVASFLTAFGYIAGQEGEDVQHVLDLAAAMRSDSLGSDTIHYFPGWQVEM